MYVCVYTREPQRAQKEPRHRRIILGRGSECRPVVCRCISSSSSSAGDPVPPPPSSSHRPTLGGYDGGDSPAHLTRTLGGRGERKRESILSAAENPRLSRAYTGSGDTGFLYSLSLSLLTLCDI